MAIKAVVFDLFDTLVDLMTENVPVTEYQGRRIPGFLQRIVVSEGELRPYVNVFVGSENVRSFSGLDTPVSDGDVVSIIPAVAGG